jgi:hypothetical protein
VLVLVPLVLVLVRFSAGTSETLAACFLHSSLFHPSKLPRPSTENHEHEDVHEHEDEDEDEDEPCTSTRRIGA